MCEISASKRWEQSAMTMSEDSIGVVLFSSILSLFLHLPLEAYLKPAQVTP